MVKQGISAYVILRVEHSVLWKRAVGKEREEGREKRKERADWRERERKVETCWHTAQAAR